MCLTGEVGYPSPQEAWSAAGHIRRRALVDALLAAVVLPPLLLHTAAFIASFWI